MKILVIHNRYREKGGEDEVVESEIKLLKQHGHSIIFYEASNEEIESLSLSNKIRYLIKEIVWSKDSYNKIKNLVKKDRPDVAHVHNIFYNLTPSIYYALKEEGVPVVQTLHNYRFLCPNALLYTKGKVCERCLQGGILFAPFYKCWRNSFFLTFFLRRMLHLHFKKNTFVAKIDIFIALSEFSKNKYIEAGFPKNKLVVKQNFIDLLSNKKSGFKNYILFVGRLQDYKGIYTLLAACQSLKDYHFKIIGDGPRFKKLRRLTNKYKNIELLGRAPYDKTIEYMKSAAFLIFPSQCYETFGRVIIEAFACGVPVITSRLGVMKEIVEDGRTGLHFNSGDAEDLAAKVKWAWTHKEKMQVMGKEAQKEYEKKYTTEKNYEILMGIYKKTIEKGKS